MTEEKPKPQQDMQLATIVNVGHALEWPRYDLHLTENEREIRGGDINVQGVSRKEAIAWLRNAADAMEAGKLLRVGFFA